MNVDRLPWPNVRGKRCLDVAMPQAPHLADELRERGAAEVQSVDVSIEGSLPSWVDGVFDVVVAVDVLWASKDPHELLADVVQVTRGVLLSAEPIDLWTSLLGRGRARFLADQRDGLPTFNGAAHRQLLDAAGFAVERVSKPYLTDQRPAERGSPEALARGVALRVLTGERGEGRLHRALLARPRVPAAAPTT